MQKTSTHLPTAGNVPEVVGRPHIADARTDVVDRRRHRPEGGEQVQAEKGHHEGGDNGGDQQEQDEPEDVGEDVRRHRPVVEADRDRPPCGWIILRNSFRPCRVSRSRRTFFIPPPVLPAHPPTNISNNSMKTAAGAQTS